MLVSEKGHSDCVELLLANDALTQLKAVTLHGTNAVMYAADNGHVDCMRLLLYDIPETQASVVDSDGDTAISCAAKHGCVYSLEALLPCSQAKHIGQALMAALNKYSATIQTADTVYADCQPFKRCVQLLLANGAQLPEEASQAEKQLLQHTIQESMQKTCSKWPYLG